MQIARLRLSVTLYDCVLNSEFLQELDKALEQKAPAAKSPCVVHDRVGQILREWRICLGNDDSGRDELRNRGNRLRHHSSCHIKSAGALLFPVLQPGAGHALPQAALFQEISPQTAELPVKQVIGLVAVFHRSHSSHLLSCSRFPALFGSGREEGEEVLLLLIPLAHGPGKLRYFEVFEVLDV